MSFCSDSFYFATFGYEFCELYDDTGNDGDVDATEEEVTEKNIEPRVSVTGLSRNCFYILFTRLPFGYIVTVLLLKVAIGAL